MSDHSVRFVLIQFVSVPSANNFYDSPEFLSIYFCESYNDNKKNNENAVRP